MQSGRETQESLTQSYLLFQKKSSSSSEKNLLMSEETESKLRLMKKVSPEESTGVVVSLYLVHHLHYFKKLFCYSEIKTI